MNLITTEQQGLISVLLSLQSYHPACYSDHRHLLPSSLGHILLCLCTSVTPLNHPIMVIHSDRPQGWQVHLFELVSVEVAWTQNLILDLSSILFDGQSVADYWQMHSCTFHRKPVSSDHQFPFSLNVWGKKNRLRRAGFSTLIGWFLIISKRGSAILQLSSTDVLVTFHSFECDTARWGLFLKFFSNWFLAVFGSTIQECDNWTGRPWPGLTALLQVHGEAA